MEVLVVFVGQAAQRRLGATRSLETVREYRG